jgi:hypothetical protein
MKRIIVWVDSADEDTVQVRQRITNYLSKAGLRYTIFDTCELIETEIE